MTITAPSVVRVSAPAQSPATVGVRLLRFCAAMTEQLPSPSSNGVTPPTTWSSVGSNALGQAIGAVMALALVGIFSAAITMRNDVSDIKRELRELPEMKARIQALEDYAEKDANEMTKLVEHLRARNLYKP